MADAHEKTLLEQFSEVLNRHGVEFIVIGGQAALLLGSTFVSYDVDVCYRRTRENLERLAAALRELEAVPRGGVPGLPYQLDARALELGSSFTLKTKFGDLDLLAEVLPIGGFDELAKSAKWFNLAYARLHVIGVLDLVRIKETLKRTKDLAVLEDLRPIAERERKRLQGEG